MEANTVQAVVPDDEKIYKHQGTSYLNLPMLILLLITIASAYYISIARVTTHDSITQQNNITSDVTKHQANQTVSNNLTKTNKHNVTSNDVNDDVTNNDVKNSKVTAETKSVKKKRTREAITNTYDKNISTYIYDGENLLKNEQYAECVSFFERLLNIYSLSPRIVYTHAQCLHELAKKMRSKALLQKAIESYGEVANKPDVPKKLLKLSLIEQAKQWRVLGHPRKAIVTLHNLTKLLPDDVEVLIELGVSYLIVGSNKLALEPFYEVLKSHPDSGVAKVHIGFILKSMSKYKESIPYLLEGIRSGEPAAIDSRFYFHLGDAYTRTGEPEEAWKIYHEAAEKNLFLSAEQRSTYNAETKLRSQPWWNAEETGYGNDIKLLEYHWKTIRDEALAIIDQDKNNFPLETEDLVDKGDWRQYELYSQGRKKAKHCSRTPRTCEIIGKMQQAVTNKRGQIKFSIMQPGTHIWPHTGPTNCRLRMHLGLVIPKNVHIRVGSETKTWRQGKVVIIDDSFDHEVWHNGTTYRMIFIVDFWHPDIPQWERKQLAPI